MIWLHQTNYKIPTAITRLISTNDMLLDFNLFQMHHCCTFTAINLVHNTSFIKRTWKKWCHPRLS